MKTIDFLKECTFNEFVGWMKDNCLGNSFNNISNNSSFQVIIINPIYYEEEYSYFTLGMLKLENLYNALKKYAYHYDEQEPNIIFELSENTRLFAYSNINELLNCGVKELEGLIEFLKDNKFKK